MDIFYEIYRNEVPFGMPKAKIHFYDLTFILDGTLYYEIEGKEYVAETGDVLFIQKEQVRERKIGTRKCEYVALNFLSDHKYPFSTLMKNYITPDIKILLELYKNSKTTYKFFSQKIKQYLLRSLLYILWNKEKIKQTTTDSPLIKKIKQYLEQNLYISVTLEQVSNAVHFSAGYCAHRFKKETGTSIIDYHLNLKIEQAKTLLVENVQSIQEISSVLGFSDYNYFSRFFKAKTSFSPTAFQRLYLGEL